VTINQARELCAKSGKRLPSQSEWYQAALGVSDPLEAPVCNVDSGGTTETGSAEACVSGSGTYDMIGNVWEWVEGSVTNGTYAGRELPDTGYVFGTDEDGVALDTRDTQQPDFHNDYFWSNKEGSYVAIRGGYFGSDSDAGIYSIHADIEPTLSGAAIGFRCVK
jgi:formylglycine-generating enzyme required for sulfatase activity